MVTQQLLDFIKQQSALGKNQQEITAALLAAGWKVEDVQQAFAQPSGVPMPTSTELPKARQILNESWAIYKNRYKTLIAIAIIPLLCYAAVGFVSAGGFIALNSYFSGAGAIILPILIVVAVIAFIYVGVWGTVAGLVAIKETDQGIGWQESYKRSRGFINPFFSTGLLSGLAVLGGFILLIVPGIIFALWFSQSPYVVIEEGLSNTAALKRSKYYVKGRIGQIFGKAFYIGIISFLLYCVLGIILGILAGITKLNYNYFSWISNIFSIIWTPLITVYSYRLYKYCKSTRP